ncbi:dicarboxylate/amino acid:cation symporter [Myroides marinus]|uniref:dicarboxylate/amino acid:cation symporter n=1 Tax=Myroides marinus TaxID=703342 RepID=UPI0025774FF9|nr:dicarboxylate/amino acid:cation symporter [Myroides marinus]MDM1378105.1 dicarboxylate/amino acid:cation symporter [Myroides marinus]MDM1385509.1 dicarboxylate/amino acid:cation symporter [Myroides marinus]MDM1392722.1 dicarboxylate/amino acid:cation symporter [Myroides marinus]
MKFLKKNLLIQIVIAIGLGSVLGNYLPESIGRIFSTFNSIFGGFLGFSIPLIIIGLIVPAIGNIGKNAGKLLLITTGIAYGSTLFAGFVSYGVSIATFPNILSLGQLGDVAESTKNLAPYFNIEMPPMFDVMSALIISFILGIGISKGDFKYLEGVFNDFQNIIMSLINKAIIPFLPLFIFGIFLNMTYNGQVYVVLGTFLKIIGVIFVLHIFVLLFQYVIAGMISKQNPFELMKNMLPAYFTALGTQSSAATIPVTLEQTLKNNVSPKIAGFTIPLCATIHLSGSTLKIVACAIALMLVQGQSIDFTVMVGFIFMLGIAMVAAPGVPGGAIMASLGVLASILGFDTEQQSLMIALYIAMDSFGTACNVMGDGAIAIIVNKISKNTTEAETISAS